MAVFLGGWTLEAAEAVGADPELDDAGSRIAGKDLPGPQRSIARADVLDRLAHPVAKSLVLLEKHPDEDRYRLLEPIRQYALGRLADTGEEPMLRLRRLEVDREVERGRQLDREIGRLGSSEEPVH